MTAHSVLLSLKIAMRWRTEDEVLAELGERTCGNLRCDHHEPAPDEELGRWLRKQERKTHSPSKNRDDSPIRYQRDRRQGRSEFDHRSSFTRLEEEDDGDAGPLVPKVLTPYQREPNLHSQAERVIDLGPKVKFAYEEDGKRQEALVKVVLCKKCGKKLHKGKQSTSEVTSNG